MINKNGIKQQGRDGTVYIDGSFSAPNGVHLTRKQMHDQLDYYRCANRIYKPFAILFYTDVMNGNGKNWE